MKRSDWLWRHLNILFNGFFFLAMVTNSFQAKASAAPVTRSEFIQKTVQQINTAKNFTECVDSFKTLPKNISDEIKAWAKSKGVMNLPKVTAHDPDIIVEMEGKRAKLTFVDFKRGVFAIDDKPFEYSAGQTVAQNFDRMLPLLDVNAGNEKSVSVSFFPQAQALVPFIVGLVFLGIIGLGISLAFWDTTSAGISEALANLAKRDGIKALNLHCGAPGPHGKKTIKFLRPGKELDQKGNPMEEEVTANFSGVIDGLFILHGTVDATRVIIDRSKSGAGAIPALNTTKKVPVPDGSEDYDVLKVAVSCCNSEGCPEKFASNKKLPHYSEQTFEIPGSSPAMPQVDPTLHR